MASGWKGMRGETWLSAMQWKANPIAHPKVRTSPRLMEERSGSNAESGDAEEDVAGEVRKRMPRKARAAPRKAFHRGARTPGGRSAGTMEKRGTRTTTSPVMNADLEGVVRTRPIV